MAKLLLVLATVANGALGALLVGVSGFLFGSGPESMHAGALATTGYVLAVMACLVAPIVRFVLNRRGKAGAGVAAAWLPIAGAFAALAMPAPY